MKKNPWPKEFSEKISLKKTTINSNNTIKKKQWGIFEMKFATFWTFRTLSMPNINQILREANVKHAE